MRFMRLHIVLPALLLFGLACSGRGGGASDGMVNSGDMLQGTGTVVWNPVEGGFYMIRGDDGKSYDPVNLPTSYQKADLRVRFRARVRTDLASYHMSAPLVEILSIDRL